MTGAIVRYGPFYGVTTGHWFGQNFMWGGFVQRADGADFPSLLSPPVHSIIKVVGDRRVSLVNHSKYHHRTLCRLLELMEDMTHAANV